MKTFILMMLLAFAAVSVSFGNYENCVMETQFACHTENGCEPMSDCWKKCKSEAEKLCHYGDHESGEDGGLSTQQSLQQPGGRLTS